MEIVSARNSCSTSFSPKLVGPSQPFYSSEHIPNTSKVISAVSDFLLSVFPILILYKVQISLQRKIGLCMLMGLGVMYAFQPPLGNRIRGYNSH